jgi:hypothetical protein
MTHHDHTELRLVFVLHNHVTIIVQLLSILFVVLRTLFVPGVVRKFQLTSSARATDPTHKEVTNNVSPRARNDLRGVFGTHAQTLPVLRHRIARVHRDAAITPRSSAATQNESGTDEQTRIGVG